MTWWRDLTFLMRGLRRFTKGAYESAAESFSPLAGPAADAAVGRHCMITGANSGIGYAAAEELLKRGVHIDMVCRSEERGREAQQELADAARKAGSHAEVRLHILDLANVPRVRAFAEAFVRSGRRLDALINNAGCMVDREEGDAIDPNTVVNLLSTALLTETILPALGPVEDGRRPLVMTVSSGGMLSSELHTDVRMQHEDKVKAYASNKRAQVALTELWAERHGAKAAFFTMHPGWADTPALKNAMPDFHKRFQDKLRDGKQGADTIVWAVLRRDEVQKLADGAFLLDRTEQDKHLPLARTGYEKEDVEEMYRNLTAAAEQRPTTDADREPYAYLAQDGGAK